MSGKGSIAVTEHGATVTVQINRAFAERLIDYIDKVPANSKAEGDNQVLAAILDAAIARANTKAPAVPTPASGTKIPRWKMRQLVKRRRGAIAFWQRLLENIQAEDGSAVAAINERIARNETELGALVAELIEREAATT